MNNYYRGLAKMASLDQGMFEVSVRDPNGHHQIIPVRPGMNVRNIKEIFAQNTGLQCDQFRLVFAGHSLNDHDTLEVVLPLVIIN